MWAVLNKEWVIRSSQDGLELMAPERNISLGLSDLKLRTQLFQILRGERKIPKDISEDAKQAIDSLSVQKIIQIVRQKPEVDGTTEIEKRLWKIRNKLVGNRGPVKEVYWLDKNLSRFSPTGSHMFMAEYLELHGKKDKKINWSFSISEDSRELAELKVIMEALERHAGGVIPFPELIKSSARKIGSDAINPQRVISYGEFQDGNPRRYPFSLDREYYWKEVIAFPQGGKKYLPAECLYYPVDESVASHPYMFANSSGVAAGFSFEEAFLRGLYETIERDAFMTVWLNRIVMPRIKKSIMPSEALSRIARIEELGYDVFLVNLTLDSIPVVLAAVASSQKRPALTIGIASDPNILSACLKAISETEQQLYWRLRYSVKSRPIRDPKKVKEIPDHMALYWNPRYLLKAEFLWAGEEHLLNPEDLKINLEVEELASRFNSQGVEVIAADLTPAFLKKLGIWIVRAIPLGLIPITFGYGNMPLGMPRLKEVDRGDQWLGDHPFVHPFS